MRQMDKSEKGYRKLILWKETMKLIRLIYQKTAKFPRTEDYGLTSQMRRAAVSVVANFVEGYTRNKKFPKDFLNYLSRSEASLAELESHLEVALENIKEFTRKEYDECESQRSKVAYLLSRYIKSVERSQK